MSNKDRRILDSLTGGNSTLNVGHGNIVLARRIVAILESGSLPIRRLRETASETNRLIDATAGRKTRSLILMDTEHIILSALAPHTLVDRMRGGESWISPSKLELEEGEFVS